MLDINKLKTGDKVAFSERVEKIVCHTCGDNGQIRSVSFTDGTILNRNDSLWELAELTELEVIWKDSATGGQHGYESLTHQNKGGCRFHVETSPGEEGCVLTEYIDFPSEDTAKIYANKRLRAWRSNCGN
jgi:hypothetical protein